MTVVGSSFANFKTWLSVVSVFRIDSRASQSFAADAATQLVEHEPRPLCSLFRGKATCDVAEEPLEAARRTEEVDARG